VLTATRLIELRLRVRGDPEITAMIDQCLVATAADAASSYDDDGREKLKRLCNLLESRLAKEA